MSTDFHVFDTTLRDGAQREGVSYSVADKLAVARLMDEIGVGFIEGGWPGALPKDTEFFARARTELDLKHAQLVAFGATRKAGVAGRGRPPGARAARRRDAGRLPGREVRRPARARGAADDARGEPGDGGRHRRVLRAPTAAGCSWTASTSSTATPPTATTASRCCETAFAAGAEVGVLCDTNGGMLPMGVGRVVAEVREPSRRQARHPLPGRHRVRGGQQPGRGRGRGHPRPGDGERLRRARGQRRHLRADRQPGHQDGPAGRARPSACPSCSGSATRSPSWPTSPPTSTSPSSAPRRSRTRPACTPARSR